MAIFAVFDASVMLVPWCLDLMVLSLMPWLGCYIDCQVLNLKLVPSHLFLCAFIIMP